MARLAVLVPLVGIALAALVWSQQRESEFFVSGVLEAHDVRVGSRVGGRVRQVHVSEGDTVEAGAALVTLEPFDLRERLAAAEAALATARAELAKRRDGNRPEEIAQARGLRDQRQAVLDRLVAGPRPREVQILEHNLEFARSELRKADYDYTRIKRLLESRQASQDEFDEKRRAFDSATARVRVAEEELELAREGTRTEEIAEGRALLAQAEAALKLAEAGARSEDIAAAEAEVQRTEHVAEAIRRELAELTIVAPGAAVVDALDLRPGDLISANAPVATLLELPALWVRAYVPENRLNLELGATVQIRVDAFPERRFRGHVAFLAREGEFTPANVQTPEDRSKQVFRTKIIVDEGLDLLRPGMAADVFFGPAE